MSLNEKQKVAVQTTEGPLLVLAGAGSGKTTVLRHKVANLVGSGVEPGAILAVTFTNKAADEMKQRIAGAIGQEAAGAIWLGTFHSLCGRMLREYPLLEWGSDFTILDPREARSMIRDIIIELGYHPDHITPQGTQYYLSLLRNELIDSLSYQTNRPTYPFIHWEKAQRVIMEKIPGDKRPHLERIYERYERRLVERNALDFDGLIFQTLRLFHESPDVLTHYQTLFRYIMVDEYQDTNHSQYLWVKSLAAVHRNLSVVGDDFQSIYAFRGSDIQNILRFHKDFPDATIVKLEENYRCSPTILQAANELIAQNTNQWKKTLFTSKLEGEKISYFQAYDEREESRYVITHIRNHVASGGQYKDAAILFRMNSQVERVIEGLEKASIPYRLVGETPFLDQGEIKEWMNHLVSSWERATPPLADWMEREMDTWTASEPLSEEQRIRLAECLSISRSYFTAFPQDDLTAFLSFMKAWGKSEHHCEENAVQLMTLHASKGLEFPIVFLIGMEENIFPHRKSIPLPDQLEEERRLCYVGMTRAKEKLHMTRAKTRRVYGKDEQNAPSRFLAEFSQELIE